MKQRSIAIICACALVASAMPLWAQQDETKKTTQTVIETQRAGSQTIALSVGGNIPLFILPVDAEATETSTLGVGASFGLQYQYFIANHISLGGSLFGSFATTLAGESLFIAPISAHVGYWWDAAPMEYTAGMDLGMTVMRLSGDGMLTPFAKLGGGAFYKIDNSWYIGAEGYLWFIPEIHTGSYSSLTRYGAFVEISASAVYHF